MWARDLIPVVGIQGISTIHAGESIEIIHLYALLGRLVL